MYYFPYSFKKKESRAEKIMTSMRDTKLKYQMTKKTPKLFNVAWLLKLYPNFPSLFL